MSVKYNIIVRDASDTKKNVKSLSDAELYDQMKTCMAICNCVTSYGEPEPSNKDLITYCSTRIGDMIDYTLDLMSEYLERGGMTDIDKSQSKLQKLQGRINMAKSKIAPFFKGDSIDWNYISTL